MKKALKGKEKTVIVSACLVGLKTRYDGSSAPNAEVAELLKGRTFVPVCPEQLGGLCTPRLKASIESGSGADVLCLSSRVVDSSGADVTDKFIKGAQAALNIARMCGAGEAFLKEKSPSCGVERIYNGGRITSGEGVTTAIFKVHGIKVRGF